MTRLKTHLNPLATALALATTALLTPLAQAADTPAYAITGDGTYIGDRSNTTGFVFTAEKDATLTALGFHDYLLDGLNVAHEVALYSMTGTMLAMATVAAGNSAALIGEYRYATLGSSFMLQAGTQYMLAAQTDATDGYRYGTLPYATVTANPLISIGAAAGFYNYGPNLTFPTSAGYDIYATPNMLLAGAVPEPGTWLLMFAGLTAMAVSVRRRG